VNRGDRHRPLDLNNRGQIVGAAYDDPAATTGQGFLLANGADGPFTPINVPNATTTIAAGINDHGQIVGAFRNDDADPPVVEHLEWLADQLRR
jgi:hypothetical protein